MAYFNRSMAKKAAEDLEGALKDLDQAIAIDQSYTMAYFNRAIAKKQLGDLKWFKDRL